MVFIKDPQHLITSQCSHCITHCLIFSSARAALHNITQQDAVYILLVLCWLHSRALILIMVYRLELHFSNGHWASSSAAGLLTGLSVFIYKLSLRSTQQSLFYLSSRLPSVNSVSVSLRHPHTLCLWSNTVTMSKFFRTICCCCSWTSWLARKVNITMFGWWIHPQTILPKLKCTNERC